MARFRHLSVSLRGSTRLESSSRRLERDRGIEILLADSQVYSNNSTILILELVAAQDDWLLIRRPMRIP